MTPENKTPSELLAISKQADLIQDLFEDAWKLSIEGAPRAESEPLFEQAKLALQKLNRMAWPESEQFDLVNSDVLSQKRANDLAEQDKDEH